MQDTIAKAWECFRSKAIPDNAGDLQINVMKVAFYSGVVSIMEDIATINLGVIPEEEVFVYLKSLGEEVEAFFKDEAGNSL